MVRLQMRCSEQYREMTAQFDESLGDVSEHRSVERRNLGAVPCRPFVKQNTVDNTFSNCSSTAVWGGWGSITSITGVLGGRGSIGTIYYLQMSDIK